MDQTRKPKVRRDGWTAARQLRFLAMLERTGSVSRAAAATGMRRESAYRLRARRDGALFGILWDRAVESHTKAPRSVPRQPKIRKIPPKVTKWRKWKDPRFDLVLSLLRDL